MFYAAMYALKNREERGKTMALAETSANSLGGDELPTFSCVMAANSYHRELAAVTLGLWLLPGPFIVLQKHLP